MPIHDSWDILALTSFSSPKYSKFGVECDWNSYTSQNVRNLGFWKKNDGFFWNKVGTFKIGEGGKFAVECV